MNSQKIVLIGPPGVGKSTLVQLAKAKGIKAIDMEDYGPNKEDRIGKLDEMLQSLGDETVIFGGADIGGNFPDEFERILLLPPKSVYLDRLQARNESLPEKAYQKGEHIYDLFLANKDDPEWRSDRIIDSIGKPDEIFEIILKKE